ncbi:hypothetical protein B0I37DRAFT_363803 [Chaetomium sp. MPI-CAGE-AT-0009]|nr:hypothetical protein B0I37DRAFT_363803 [Chaetomium sp. MPI-CAGE-AT-0009]
MPAHHTNSAEFIHSQVGGNTERPLTYTGSPWQLVLSDAKFLLSNIYLLPFLFWPFSPCPNGPLDELYPSLPNLQGLALHFVLFFLQLGFLISLLFLTYLPVSLYTLYILIVLGLNVLVCRLLNGGIPADGLHSTEDEVSRKWEPHPDESWIFLNGICVGKHWLQSNVDLLSRIFRRPVVGVHNKTSGVVFDLVQCLIQRWLLYATSDIRDCYILVKKALYRREIKKVVLILHSQGGIEGGMIVDWLLNEVPQDLLQNLEVYTFGCMANHFNNPYRSSASSAAVTAAAAIKTVNSNILRQRAISHVEHYANNYDFASRFGVLNFTQIAPKDKLENRFMGRVFVNPKTGHQLNQHYLSSIFPLDATGSYTRDPEDGDFMALKANVNQNKGGSAERESLLQSLCAAEAAAPLEGTLMNVTPTSPVNTRYADFVLRDGGVSGDGVPELRMWQLSRLWMYRNGLVPPSEPDTSIHG